MQQLQRPLPRPDGPRPKHWPVYHQPTDTWMCICGQAMTLATTAAGRIRLYQHVARHTNGWFRLFFHGQRRRQQDGEVVEPRRDCVTSQAVPGHFMIYWRGFGAWDLFPRWKGIECECGKNILCESVSGSHVEKPRVAAARHRRQIVARLLGLNPEDMALLDDALKHEQGQGQGQEQ